MPSVITPGRSAVVTGAASGIGLALSRQLKAAGMNVLMVDIEAETLEAAAADVGAAWFPADVSRAEDWYRVYDEAIAGGYVHLLINCAGVILDHSLPVWETAIDDWDWLFGVNLYGSIHSARLFVPHMLAHGEPAHVVNVSSFAGLGVGRHAYNVSKAALASLSEAMYGKLSGTNVGVTCAYPTYTNTRLLDSERNRPGGAKPLPEDAAWKRLDKRTRAGLSPDEMAAFILKAVQGGRFYAITPDWNQKAFLKWAGNVAARKNPGAK